MKKTTSIILLLFALLLVNVTDCFSQKKMKNKDAYFSGDEYSLDLFLQENTKSPTALNTDGITGVVKVQFEISEAASIENVEVAKGLCPSCDEEAIRVVKSIPLIRSAYKKGMPIRSKEEILIPITSVPDNYIYRQPDTPAEYGGDNTLQSYLNSQINYPNELTTTGPSGYVQMSFVVNKKGKVENVQVMKGMEDKYDAEAIRILSESGPWKPATKWDELVNTKQTTIITFIDPKEEQARLSNTDLPEVMPEFPGGDQEMFRFIANNVKYPIEAKESNVQGKVFIKFTVSKYGYIENPTILKGIGSGCDKEALRVMSISPRWKPGIQLGKTVNVAYTVPINFMLR